MSKKIAHAEAIAEKKKRQKRYAELASSGANLLRSCSLNPPQKELRKYIPANF